MKHQQPAEPHLAVRHQLALAILNSRAAIADLAVIRSAERVVNADSAEICQKYSVSR